MSIQTRDPSAERSSTFHSAKASAASSSSGSASSGSDGESSSSRTRMEDQDSSDEEDLDALLDASTQVYRQRAEAEAELLRQAFTEGADEISLDGGQSKAKSPATKQLSQLSKSQGALPPSSKDPYRVSGTAEKELRKHLERLESGAVLGPSHGKSKRQVQRERKEAKANTAGSGWFDLPAFPGAEPKKKSGQSSSAATSGGSSSDARHPTAEQMRREVQAIRLRNAMDPKRFYRGGDGAGEKGMPKFAQLGKIVSSSLEPNSALSRQERGRTVVEELVRDAESAAYAKRKFSEVQAKGAAGGKGFANAKKQKRQPKW